MIVGRVTDGVPHITLRVAETDWIAVIDTGFNGDLELPLALKDRLKPIYIGSVTSFLAGGQQIEEDAYLVEILFDERRVFADATFVPGNEILLGTRLLKSYSLEIDFPATTVALRRQND